MNDEKLQATFNQQAASAYDSQWARLAPFRDALHLLASAVLAGYNGVFGLETAKQTLDAFQATFATMGLVTIASALIFWHLPAEVRAAHPAQPEVSGQG